MSVGHVARLMEAAGMATVVIAVRAFRDQLQKMTLPRVITTPHLLGKPLGAPGDRRRQRASILAALDLLENTIKAGTIYDLPGSFQSG